MQTNTPTPKKANLLYLSLLYIGIGMDIINILHVQSLSVPTTTTCLRGPSNSSSFHYKHGSQLVNDNSHHNHQQKKIEKMEAEAANLLRSQFSQLLHSRRSQQGTMNKSYHPYHNHKLL